MDMHRNRSARREDAERLIIADPSRSDRAIARELSMDHKTIGAIRRDMESRKARADETEQVELPLSPGGEIGNSPPQKISEVGTSKPQGGEMVGTSALDPLQIHPVMFQHLYAGRPNYWRDRPEDSLIVSYQAATIAYIHPETCHLIILQHDDEEGEQVIKIAEDSIEKFMRNLIEITKIGKQ